MRRPRIVVAGDLRDFARQAVSTIAGIAEEGVAVRGRCSIALAGGSTPRPVYEELSRSERSESLPWESLHFYFGDERCVPLDHPSSNYWMAEDALFSRRPLPAGNIHPMLGFRVDREEVASEYEALLPDRLDILLLGVGEDGHTASLFPGSSALRERKRRVVAIEVPADPPWRITITPVVIENARTILVLARGERKAGVVARALLGTPDADQIPIQLARRGVWILDPEAAAGLPESFS
jgi:6-phosphogluconolactonase